MEIPVVIPWKCDNNIGEACNEWMGKVDDWICILDHDILSLHVDWYRLIVSSVIRVGHGAGWISGTASSTYCSLQKSKDSPKNHNIMDHMEHAEYVYKMHGTTIIDVTDRNQELSGFMVLTHKQAWKDVGGFDSSKAMDWDYYRKIKNSKYRMYIIPGLYFYHTHIAKPKEWRPKYLNK